MKTLTQVRFIWKPIAFAVSLVPALWVIGDLFEITGTLGANPVEAMLDRFGIWGLRFIMITLAITPLRRLTGWNWLLRFRRMFGLFTFFYVLMHFLTWLLLDRELLVEPDISGIVLPAVIEDIVERPFITLGFTAFLLLIAMAVTSTNGIRRRMGRNWDKLHYSAYLVGILGVWHYWWQVKNDITEPLIYALILTVVLGLRILWRLRRRS
ncbi:MAG: sulfoxide reductase heme-binding subunit YedZ [Gammaproteobacteria bacterium]|nr:sulfoxide reductase heme-binding subunit YedZ [Gammaproteobacteria bacterium]